MPESPEVQVLAEFLAHRMVGHDIVDVELLDARSLATRAQRLEQIEGHHISAVIRWGKHIDIDTGHWHLVVTFGRHGWARWYEEMPETVPPDESAPAVARLRLDDGSGVELTDAGDWRSLALSVVPDATKVPAIAGLGPDPADATFTRGDFERALGGRRKRLKALLQDQTAIAGIGNAYSDEILHVARLSPVARAVDLDVEQSERLFEATRSVVRDAIDARRGVVIAELKQAKVGAMKVHGRAGEECRECQGLVADVAGSDGTAQYCASCQPD